MKFIKTFVLLFVSAIVLRAQNPIQRELYAADAGSTDTYAASFAVAPSAYVAGRHYTFKANTVNTGAASINFNSLGAKTIVKVAGGITTALADGDIKAGQIVDLVYDGTNMQMQSTLGNTPSGGSGTPGGSNTQLQYNSSGSFAGISGATTNGTILTLTNANINGTITNTQGSLAGSSTPAYSHTATWNNASTVFIDSLVDITNTASDSSSSFAVWRIGGVDKFSVNRSGDLAVAGNILTPLYIVPAGGLIQAPDGLGSATKIHFPVGGNMQITNVTDDDFGLLQFACTANTCPALKRSTTGLQVRLADDSGFTFIQGLYKSSDGTSGATVTTCTGFKNGLCISGS